MKIIKDLNKIAVFNFVVVLTVVLLVSYTKNSAVSDVAVIPSDKAAVAMNKPVTSSATIAAQDIESGVQSGNDTTEDSPDIVEDTNANEPTPDQSPIEPQVDVVEAPVVSKASQVSNHNTPSDCWMIIDGSLYDITAYFGSHPGGDPNLLRACGTDASVAFHTKGKSEAKDHSAAAIAILAQYKIE